MTDMLAPKALALTESSNYLSTSEPHSNFEVLNLTSTHHTLRCRSAIAANIAISKAAQYHGECDGEVETTQPKRVKKVTFTEETKSETSDVYTPALNS